MTSFGRFLFSAGGYPLTGEAVGEGEVVSVAGRAAVVMSCAHVIKHRCCRTFGHHVTVCGTRHARVRRDTHATGTKSARFRSCVSFDRSAGGMRPLIFSHIMFARGCLKTHAVAPLAASSFLLSCHCCYEKGSSKRPHFCMFACSHRPVTGPHLGLAGPDQ